MFLPANLMGSNSYRVVAPPDTPDVPNVHLHNLGNALGAFEYDLFKAPETLPDSPIFPYVPDSFSEDADKKQYFGTNRIYRLYKRSGEDIEQLWRIDWELSPPSSDDSFPSWLPYPLPKKDDVAKSLAEELSSITHVDAVIIKDNGKGVVSRALIKLLMEHDAFTHLKLKERPWFIQTKRWEPTWLKDLLGHVNIPLLVYHSVALQSCPDVETWLTAHQGVAPKALEQLVNIHKCSNKQKGIRLCVALPGYFSAIALASKEEEKVELLFQPRSNPNGVHLEACTGSATAIFAALTYGLLQSPEDMISPRFLIEGALRVAQYWTQSEYSRLVDADRCVAPKELVLSLAKPNEADEGKTYHKISLLTPTIDKHGKTILDHADLPSVGTVVGFDDIVPELNRWHESSTQCGLSKDKSGRWYLELSRATIELSGFVCVAPDRRRQLARLIKEIKAFDPQHSKSLSGLILAKPGSGKTTLVGSLARDLGLNLLSYNITNMMTFDDLLFSFDQIVTSQLENRGKKLLVFVDEVNAHINKQAVYEAFLTPLEDGYYVRSGTKRMIQSCIWLFVGTGTLKDIENDSKGSDFTSRMSLDPIRMSDVPKAEEPHLYIENIYVGAIFARKEYPWLDELDHEVIAVLGALGEVGPKKASSSVNISNRFIRRLIAHELHVDGAGRGRWKKHLEKLRHEQSQWINETVLNRNLDSFDKMGIKWVQICDRHPDNIPK